MLDFRRKTKASVLNWRYQEIIVTPAYLEQNPISNLITLDRPYQLGKKVLDIYINGQRVKEGTGFREVDQTHVYIDLGKDANDEDYPLIVGDEIVIKEWYNTTVSQSVSSNIDPELISQIQTDILYLKNNINTIDFDLQRIEVDQSYIDTHADINLITLNRSYELNKNQLDVYFNGVLLSAGEGYEEVDGLHIRILFLDNATLEREDELIIRFWKKAVGSGSGGVSQEVIDLINQEINEIKELIESVEGRYQYIKVDQSYIDAHQDLNLITLDSAYERFNNSLDVYLNGVLIATGEGYLEVDSTHIRFLFEDNGTLELQDEIIIRECCKTRLPRTSLPQTANEVITARNEFPNLKARLDSMQSEIDLLKLNGGGGSSNNVISNTPITYNISTNFTRNSSGGITREDITGDFTYSKQYILNSNNFPVVEVNLVDDKSYTKTYEYFSDIVFIEKGEFVEILPTVNIQNKATLSVFNQTKKYFKNNLGLITKEEVSGDVSYTKEITYNGFDVTKEVWYFENQVYEKNYSYFTNYFREYGFDAQLVDCNGHVTLSFYIVDRKHFTQNELIYQIVDLGTFKHTFNYQFNGYNLTSEQSTINNVNYTKTFTYDANDDVDVINGTYVLFYGDKLEIAYNLAGKANKSIELLLGQGNYEVAYTYADGKVIKEEVTGEHNIVKEYQYNANKIIKEIVTYMNKKSEKLYEYNVDGTLNKIISTVT